MNSNPDFSTPNALNVLEVKRNETLFLIKNIIRFIFINVIRYQEITFLINPFKE